MIDARLGTIEADVAHIKKTTDETHKVVYGNGDPKAGLASRLVVTETVVERLERVIWLVSGSALASVVGAVFAVVRTAK